MDNNEIWESIKKAFKVSMEKLNSNYVFSLDEMVTPKLITLLYWISLFAIITKGLGDIFIEGDFWRGMVYVIGGPIAFRIACELVLVLFRINENMTELNNKANEIEVSSNPGSEKDYYNH